MVQPGRYPHQVVVLLSLALSLLCGSASAQTFLPKQNISNTTGTPSHLPQMASDTAGTTYVVWENDIGSVANILFSSSSDGVTFTAPKNISNTTHFANNPRIAVGAPGTIYVIWEDNPLNNQDVFFSSSLDGGQTFSTPVNLSNDPPDSTSPQIVADANGHVNIAWENDTITYGILCVHSGDFGASFSKPANLSTNTLGSFGVSLAQDGAGNVYAAFEDDFSTQAGISFNRSTDYGATFLGPQTIYTNPVRAFSAQLALDPTGNINATWVGGTTGSYQVNYARSTNNGAAFSPAIGVASSTWKPNFPQIGADGSGNVYIAWQQPVPPSSFRNGIYFSHSSNNGAAFSSPLYLSNDNGAGTMPAMILDADSEVNVSWEDTSTGESQIFFKQSVDSGATFSTVQNLSSSTGLAFDISMSADPQGHVNVVWDDNAPGVSQVFFTRFTAPKKANQPPVANAGADQTVVATGPNGATVTLDGSQSTDPNGLALSYQWMEGSTVVGNTAVVSLTASIGTHTYTLTVKDTANLSNSAVTHVTVSAQAPLAKVGPDQTVTATGPNGAQVALDGSQSSDPNGYTLTYQWTEGSTVLGNTATVAVTASIGTHTYMLTVTNTAGLSATAFTHVTVKPAAPVANAGADQTVVATGPNGAQVALNGSLSSDPNGYALTYQWTEGSTVLGNTATLALTASIGTHTYTLTVTNTAGLSNSAVTHVTVKPQPPVANAGADQTVVATGPNGAQVALNGSLSSDPNGYALTYQWTEGSTVVGNTATVALTASIGTHTYTLTVTNTAGLSATAFTHVTVKPAAPVANAGADQTVVATGPNGAQVALNGSLSSDPNGYALTYQWTEGSTVVGNTATLALTASIGTHTYTLTVTDTAGLSNSAVTHVTVKPQPPVANAGADQTVVASGPNGAQVALNGSLSSDPNGYALTYQWTEGSTVVGNTATVALTASIGTHTYTLTVTDTAGLSNSAVTHVTVKPQPPVANAGTDQTVVASGPNGAQVALNGSLSSDPNGYALTYQWTEGGTVVGNTATVALTASIGTHTYTLTVTDTAGLSNSAVTHVTVKPQPPVANAGTDQTVVASGPNGAQVALNGSLSSDPNGYALTYQWTEGGTVVGNTATVALTASIGTHTYTLTVTDTAGLSNSAVTHVTVNPRPPVANAGADQTLLTAGPSGAPVTLNGSLSSDPNGYALTYVWTEGTAVVGNSAVVSLTASIGTHTYTLTVKDTAGLSASAVTHVTVNPRPPVVAVIGDPQVECGGPNGVNGTAVKLDGSGSYDPNGYPLKYMWTDDSGSVVGNTAVAMVLVKGLGQHSYTLTVTDTTTGQSARSTPPTVVTLVDTTAPTLSFTLTPSVTRPRPNQLVLVKATINVTDACDPNPAVKLVVTSNDPADRGRRQVKDVQAVSAVSAVSSSVYVQTFELRAERPENGSSLVYTVTYTATDHSNNTTTKTATLGLAAH